MMDVGEDLDREVIIERAESLRAWLAGFGLSGRSATALERELQGIIGNDPGSYINGQRPLAGYTIAEFVAALHSRSGGAVGQVKSVGDAVLKELRAAIPPDAASAVEPEPVAELAVEPEPVAETTAEPVAEAAETAAEPVAAPKRRGRPKGSTSARKNGVAEPVAEAAETAAEPVAAVAEPVAEPAPRRRGRPKGSTSKKIASALTPPAAEALPPPRPTVAVAPSPPAPAASSGGDVALGQLVRLWPGLHPQARRAVVLYASELLAEAAAGR